MVQLWVGSHDLPRSDRTLGPQVPVLTTVTSLFRYISMSTCCGGDSSMPHDLTTFANCPQMVEVRKSNGRPCCLQASTGRATCCGEQCQPHFPLMYFSQGFLFESVIVTDPGDVSRDPPLIQLASSFIESLVLWHRSDDELFEPCGHGLHWLASYFGLGIDVIDVQGASWAVVLGKDGDHAVVQQLDPFGRSLYTITLIDSEQGEAIILFITGWHMLPRLFLELSQLLVKVSNHPHILILLLVVKSVLVPDGLNKRFGDASKSDWVVEVKAMEDISSSGRRDGVSAGDQHEHGDINVRGLEWKGVW